jgi:hypothetical protein
MCVTKQNYKILLKNRAWDPTFPWHASATKPLKYSDSRSAPDCHPEDFSLSIEPLAKLTGCLTSVQRVEIIELHGIPWYCFVPPKQTHGDADEAHRQNIMVDGSCPKKFVSASERMLGDLPHRAGTTTGINS